MNNISPSMAKLVENAMSATESPGELLEKTLQKLLI